MGITFSNPSFESGNEQKISGQYCPNEKNKVYAIKTKL